MPRLFAVTLRLLPLLLALGARADNALSFLSPLDYQVFQRRTATSGVVIVEGLVGSLEASAPKPDRLELRLTPSGSTAAPPAWVAWPWDGRVRRFRVELAAPAGGWYQLEARLSRGQQVVAENKVEHVGVGEIFLIAGQSNSANHGEERQRPKSPLVVGLGPSSWQPAVDPQPRASGTGGSFLPAFGDALAARLKVPIGLVAIGVGATSVREWLPKGDPISAPPTTGANAALTGSNRWASTGSLYRRLVETTDLFGREGFRAVLWHQGESDNHQPPDREITPALYRAYLQRVIEASRAAAGWRVPWFVALASYHTPDDPGSPELRAAQRSLATESIVLEGPNTDELGTPFRDGGGKGVHFNARGLQRHGELWAEKILPWLEAQLRNVPPP